MFKAVELLFLESEEKIYGETPRSRGWLKGKQEGLHVIQMCDGFIASIFSLWHLKMFHWFDEANTELARDGNCHLSSDYPDHVISARILNLSAAHVCLYATNDDPCPTVTHKLPPHGS